MLLIESGFVYCILWVIAFCPLSMAQNITLMACVADALLIECVQHSPSPPVEHVQHHSNLAVHFGAYLERIRPGSKSTHILFSGHVSS